MYSNKINFKFLNIILLLVLFILISFSYSGIAAVFSRVLSLVAPFIVGFALAYGLTPFVKSLEKKGLKKTPAIMLVLFLFLGLFVGTLILTLPILITQTGALITELISLVNGLAEKYDLNLSNTIADLTNIQKLVTDFGMQAGNWSIVIFNKITSVVMFVVLAIISALYFLIDMDSIRKNFKNYLLRTNKNTYEYVKLLDNEISNYFKGYWKFMMIQFVEYTLIFFFIGHPYFLVLGILAAITGIIPYVGGFITNVFACITAALISNQLLILCLLVIVIAPQIDCYIIAPRVYDESNDIHPLLNIFAVFICGALWGMVGIIIAIPLLLIIMTTIKFYNKEINSKIHDIKDEIAVKE